ncbi:SDR family oxidoreductase [Roseivirga sp. BDSF3-8]|uniref:SDR family oxidoreductase n=1 Tax=Roseivirga sp. BDSF3-8 TaxID=3241598 RepID=UPI003531CCFA
MKTIVITGVSTGIGKALAEVFCQNSYHVFGSVRRAEDAADLGQAFPEYFTPLVFDVQDEEAIDEAVNIVERRLAGGCLSGLINNAGIAIGGPLELQPLEEVQRHFNTNVMGVVRVIRAFLPLLGTRPECSSSPGRILNISSVSGKLADPFVGAYAASKHALEALTASWRQELKVYGIKMVLIGPGSVDTPIWEKGIHPEKYAGSPYSNSLQKAARMAASSGKEGWSPGFIAEKIYRIFHKKNPGRRYALVANKTKKWTIRRLLPLSITEKVAAWLLGLK